MSAYDQFADALTSLISSAMSTNAPSHYDGAPTPYACSYHTFYNTYEIAYRQDQNGPHRAYMEDAVQVIEDFTSQFPLFLGLYDGHGGAYAMEYCLRHFAKEVRQALVECGSPESAFPLAFERMDYGLLKEKSMNVGTTATICLISAQNVIYTANVGDSEAFLVSESEVIPLTEIHRCENPAERERLLCNGVKIIRDRVQGRLMLTRALGDHELKNKGVLWSPYVSCRYFPNTFDLIIASDGVWDSVKAKDLVRGSSAKESARLILDQAHNCKSRDNISVIVVSWRGQ